MSVSRSTPALVEAADLHKLDRTQRLLIVEKVLQFELQRVAALLGADLHNAIIVSSSADHLLAFPMVVCQGLLDIDVFAGFARPDGSQRVPVVARGNDHRIHAGVFQQTAQVAKSLRFRVLFSGRGERFFIDVAQRRKPHVRQLLELAHQFISAAAQADEAEIQLLVEARGAYAANRQGSECGRLNQEGSTMHTRHVLSSEVAACALGTSAVEPVSACGSLMRASALRAQTFTKGSRCHLPRYEW